MGIGPVLGAGTELVFNMSKSEMNKSAWPIQPGQSCQLQHGMKTSRRLEICQVLYDVKWSQAAAALREVRVYRPLIAFQRMVNMSANILRLSPSMLTFVAGECPQRTGISMARNP